MKTTPLILALGAAALLSTGLVQADKHAKLPKVKHGLESCAPAVLSKHPGDILQAVLKAEGKESVWELEVKSGGKFYDVECSADSGKIVETEERVASADDAGFKAKAKVNEAAARATALAKHPGEVEAVEFEIEPDGKVSYEYDIKTAAGDLRVEVDAVSGAIVESSKELLEIGKL